MAGFSYAYVTPTVAQSSAVLSAALDAEAGILPVAIWGDFGGIVASTNRIKVFVRGDTWASITDAIAAVGGCELSSGDPVTNGD